jgi:glyoxylase-like metal-dependent hydrolase (beta-lactamase superfamily II)
LWEAATGILFAGDVVYDGELIEDAYHSNPADYYRSMVRLYDIPVRVVHAGHFASYGRARHQQMICDWLDAKDAK